MYWNSQKLKHDDLYGKEYDIQRQVIFGENIIVHNYNMIRLHASLGGPTPNALCQQYANNPAA